MKNLTYMLVLVSMLFQVSCQKNPFEELEEGGWNNERNVIDIKFENQVGKPEITRINDKTGSIEVTINVSESPDLSDVAIQSMQLSYQAESSVAIGEALNFENASNSATLSVTSPTGKTREYTVTAKGFTETLLGTYDIQGFALYGGTGPEFGGGAVLHLNDKPWAWPAEGGPGAELDNVLTFELSGFTEEGNTYGTVTNSAGDDGLYANFFFSLDPETDVNHFYRKIPKGEGQWLRDYSTGLITFTFPDGSTASGSLEGPGTEDLGNGLSKTITDNAFAFNLNGTDDWDNVYSDYDKFVKRPRRLWIEVKKH